MWNWHVVVNKPGIREIAVFYSSHYQLENELFAQKKIGQGSREARKGSVIFYE